MLEDAALALAAYLFTGCSLVPVVKYYAKKKPTHDCLDYVYLVIPVQNIYRCSWNGCNSEFVYDQGEYRRLSGIRN